MNKKQIFGTSEDDFLLGTKRGESIYGLKGDDKIEGGRGNDRLIGGLGADEFILTPGDGHDSIIDFRSIEGDKINLSAFGMEDISDLNFTSKHGNTTISFGGGDSLLLFGVDGSSLTNSDFLF